MTCQECEWALALEESREEIKRHLAECVACRAIAEEMEANSAALAALAADEIPEVRFGVMAQIRAQASARRVLRWGWALAAAAAVFVVVSVWPHQQTIAPPAVQVAVAPPRIEIPQAAPPQPAIQEKKTAPLMVKMLTDDPDVVIYWQLETKEGTEQ